MRQVERAAARHVSHAPSLGNSTGRAGRDDDFSVNRIAVSTVADKRTSLCGLRAAA